MTVSQARVSQGKIRINVDGLLKELPGALKILLSKLMDHLPALQVEFIRLDAPGWKTAERRSILAGQCRPQGRCDAHGNLILNCEDVFHGAIVTLSPQALAAFDLNQLQVDAQLVSRTTHTAFQHMRGLQPFAQ